MKTYAVVKRVVGERMFDGRVYAPTTSGSFLRVLDTVGGVDYAQLATYGAAMKDIADAAAQRAGGFVVEVQSTEWPGSRSIRKALRAAL